MSSGYSRRRGAALSAIAALALVLAACGGDDEEPATPGPTGPTGATGATGATVTADELASCLDGADLDASVSGSPVTGLEGPHERVVVAIGDLDEGAVFAAFETAEAADAESTAFGALAGVADTQVAGNVAYGFDAIAEQTPADEAAVEGCLP